MDDKPRITRRLLWTAAITLACAALACCAWWLARGRTIYTDGQSIQVARRDANPREVLWTSPSTIDADLQSPDQQYEPSLSADGAQLYFVRGKPGRGADLFVSYRRDNRWTPPTPLAGINTPDADDLGPRASPDGKLLYFYSDRPGGVGGYDLWAAPREEGGWGRPFNLGPAVNTEFNEMNPDPAPDGRRLIFSTDRKAASREQVQAWRGTIRQTGSGDYDLWTAAINPAPAATTQPTAAPPVFTNATEIPGVNTDFVEGASAMSPVGDFLYFASNRPGGLGKFDLYRARALAGGEFTPAENLGATINSPDNDADPALSMGGFRLHFSSDRAGRDGVYVLLTADSREVFAIRAGRDLPRLGWSAWSLLISLLLLVPLILALRGAHGHLGTLQRCLIASLLVHVLLTIALSFVFVTQEVVRYVRRENGTGGNGVAVNLNVPRDVEIGLAVRGQYSSDIPIVAAEPMPISRTPNRAIDQTSVTPVTIETSLPPTAQVVALADALLAPRAALPPPASPSAPVVLSDVTAALSPLPSIAPRIPTARIDQPSPQLASTEAPIAIDRQPSQPAAVPPDGPPAMNLAAVPPTTANLTDIRIAPASPGPAVGSGHALDAVLAAAATTVGPSQPIGSPAALDIQPPAPPAGRVPVETTPSAIASSERPAPTNRMATPAAGAGISAPREIAAAGAIPAKASAVGVGLLAAASPKLAGAAEHVPPLPAPRATETLATPVVVVSLPAPLAGALKSGAGAPSTSAPRGNEIAGALGRREMESPSPTTRATVIAAADVPAQPDRSSAGIARAPALSTDAAVPPLARPVAAMPLPRLTLATPNAPEPPAGARGKPAPGTAQAPAASEVALASARVETGTPLPRPPSVATPVAIPTAPARTADLDSQVKLNLTTASAIEAPLPPVVPSLSPAAISTPLPSATVAAPAAPFPRSPEDRQPRIEKQGGTRESEAAIDRGLAYLARHQQPDGRWTLVLDDAVSARRPKDPHDMAQTGLAVLAMLTRDNTPDKPGPYRAAVTKGLGYLIAMQDDNGDLRGEHRLRGEGSRRGGMYDHAIATLALAEAALMTKDARYTAAALRGAAFIVAAQDERSGGWRYVPGEYGDSSVFGWQIMALHAAEQLGFETPAETRTRAARYLRLVGQGRHGMLAGYQPGRAPTPPMTAEILYARMLLGQKITDGGLAEAYAFLAQSPPDVRQPNLYYWYYGSLCMLQAQDENWKRWNTLTRDAIVALQQRGGRADGSWNADPRNADRGGRIYMTSVAVLTLEVYYRYLPLNR